MRAFTLSIIVSLARFATLSFAVPVVTGTAIALTPRSQFCSNAPTVVAGTFNRRSLVLHDLIDRAKASDPVTVWCAPGVFTQGDRLGYYELYLVNSNNHQQSWGVVGAALAALRNFLVSLDTINPGGNGGVQFTVFDGANEVGQGTIA
ncbi:MAG: hypothetical protein FRX48_09591 [Lasallia pustulata]|uniref:Uncharacterized protein n=1 Tax=Lasallia pustulata TaxID=136370 RepID=A0A5M8PBH6_9LECA|nr:MAG: hypothetical protein FRX48_09591 [Lasallia pustulata]